MTRYCPACRTEFEGDSPPYSVIHKSETEHFDPITHEAAVAYVPPPPQAVTTHRRRNGRLELTGFWRPGEAEALADYLEAHDELYVVRPAGGADA